MEQRGLTAAGEVLVWGQWACGRRLRAGVEGSVKGSTPGWRAPGQRARCQHTKPPSRYCSRRSHCRHQFGRRQVPAGAAPWAGNAVPVLANPPSRHPLHFLSRPSRRRSDGRAALGAPGREVESARPPPALPPLSAAAAVAPARAAGGRDAPALPGGARTLPQCRGRSSQPEGGDAACACPALLPPLEMNMSLPGRVSCSMLNCFVSAAFYSPSLLRGSGAVSQRRSPAHMPVEASSGSAREEGGSPSHMPEDTVAGLCCPGWAQGHSSARRRGLSPGRPWSLCWAPRAPRPVWSSEITVLEQPSPGEPRAPSLAAAVQDPSGAVLG